MAGPNGRRGWGFRVFYPLGASGVLILKPGRDGWELREMLPAEITSADQFFALVGVNKRDKGGKIPGRGPAFLFSAANFRPSARM